ncbi:MAG: cycloisomaltooligosaccharide glucanotransferase, partial [Bacteroidia bacterium]|nr:cycloisomaltooligosaccharide glucanotransferase [Bacteroidia bacterium]
PEVMTLPKPPFLSDIYWLDPSNPEWQEYIQRENRKVYQHLDFDGYHMDQLGDWGLHYTYAGKEISMDKTYKSFIESIKNEQPNKFIAMNAVNQYGQHYIAGSPADFLYTEVWAPHDSYNDLAYIIQQNNTWSGNSKNTILAAYMNYEMAENKGFFNTPAVLMTNAVIFAFGGAHLELGEHMLGKEYFPNNNLQMKDDLKTALISYYDFLVAYQNLLRDGGTFNQVAIRTEDENVPVNNWPAKQGSVSLVCKKMDKFQVVHFINFKDAKNLEWKDNKGIQAEPFTIGNIKMILETSQPVKNVWVASPDFAGAASRPVNFLQDGNQLHFVLPGLKYWSMVVFEYE